MSETLHQAMVKAVQVVTTRVQALPWDALEATRKEIHRQRQSMEDSGLLTPALVELIDEDLQRVVRLQHWVNEAAEWFRSEKELRAVVDAAGPELADYLVQRGGWPP